MIARILGGNRPDFLGGNRPKSGERSPGDNFHVPHLNQWASDASRLVTRAANPGFRSLEMGGDRPNPRRRSGTWQRQSRERTPQQPLLLAKGGRSPEPRASSAACDKEGQAASCPNRRRELRESAGQVETGSDLQPDHWGERGGDRPSPAAPRTADAKRGVIARASVSVHTIVGSFPNKRHPPRHDN